MQASAVFNKSFWFLGAAALPSNFSAFEAMSDRDSDSCDEHDNRRSKYLNSILILVDGLAIVGKIVDVRWFGEPTAYV